MFRLGLLRDALARAGDAVTDEASAIEALGLRAAAGAGRAAELQGHLARGLRAGRGAAARRRRHDASMRLPTLRIGEGWDMHALVAGPQADPRRRRDPAHARPARPFRRRRAAARDHRRAVRRRRARRHRPPLPRHRRAFSGADSLALLAEAARRVRAAGWQIGNVDAPSIAQAPKLAPHIAADARSASPARSASRVDQVNVKAKTAEKMGPVGEGRAIEARAVCLLRPLSAQRSLRRGRRRGAGLERPRRLGRARQARASAGCAPPGRRRRRWRARSAPPMRCTAFSTIARPEPGAGGRGARRVAAEERRGQLRQLLRRRRPGRGRAR